MGNTKFSCSRQGLIMGPKASGKTLLYMNLLFRNQEFKSVDEETLGFNFDILNLEHQNVGLFDVGSTMKSFDLDSKIFENIVFDFLIFVVGPFSRATNDFDNLYRGKNEFVYAANLNCFRKTKIFLVLNERQTKSKDVSESVRESEAKYFFKMFQLKHYGSRVKMFILDASNKNTYLDLLKGIYELVLKSK